MAAIGFDTAYPGLDLASFLTARGARYVPLIAKTCLSDGLPMGAFQQTRWFATSNPIDTAAWRTRMSENRLADRRPPAFPMFTYHGRVDEAVDYRQGKALRDSWCAQGAEITWRSVFAEHLTAYMFLAPSAVTRRSTG